MPRGSVGEYCEMIDKRNKETATNVQLIVDMSVIFYQWHINNENYFSRYRLSRCNRHDPV